VSADEPPKAGRREWTGLAVIALPCLLYSMDLTVLELAVPKLSADLEPTSSQLLWIIDIYGAFVLDPDGNNIEAVCHGPEQEA
jgi:MFS transporter, DHA2 family, multidrug resistance protein